jgi:predicted dehydrogenase
MIGIIGSGFGLYGYLPAVCNFFGSDVSLLHKSKDSVFKRTELNAYFKNITWIEDINSLLASCDTLIIAIPPEAQSLQLIEALKKDNIKKFFLEKPLAPSPQESINLLDILLLSNKEFSIAYLFRYTEWSLFLKNNLLLDTKIKKVNISWLFNAHHYKNNIDTWKSKVSKGGGALRFYGIHLIALLFEFGYTDITSSYTYGSSQDDCAVWNAQFSGKDLPLCDISINTMSPKSRFFISAETNTKTDHIITIDLETPFPIEKSVNLNFSDSRSGILEKMFNLYESSSSQMYKGVNFLWLAIENKNMHSIV